jgi:hypothetical protein
MGSTQRADRKAEQSPFRVMSHPKPLQAELRFHTVPSDSFQDALAFSEEGLSFVSRIPHIAPEPDPHRSRMQEVAFV